MYLNEIKNIQQDEWSTSGITFNDGYISILGWSGRASSYNKNYICLCSNCAKDPELFGDGIFLSTKTKLISGRIPCGCSKSHRRSEDQWLVIVRRECEKSGFTLLSYGKFEGKSTRGVFVCPIHGELEPKTFTDFVNGGRRCIECRRYSVVKSNTVSDEQHIAQILSAGTFHKESKFSRSDKIVPHKKYREGIKPYWWFTCGECNETHESLLSCLKRGSLPCSCGKYSNQTIGYIHEISDNGVPLCLKFGITKSHKSKRQTKIRSGTCFDVTNIGKWKFLTSRDCKKAEKVIKMTLDCGILPKSDFKDGWTETTSIENLDSIIKIFEDYGGIRMENK